MSVFYYSESDNDFLETCRASTLLAELEDDDELPEPDDDDDDENEDGNEDEVEFEEVMVSGACDKRKRIFFLICC